MVSNLQIPKELRKKIDNELQSGEFIKWIGQPVPRFFPHFGIIIVFWVGIPWTSYSIYFMLLPWLQSANLKQGILPNYLGSLFLVPFVLVGFHLLSAPIWEWQQARNTVYLITDKRAISIEGSGATTIRSFLPAQLKDIYRKERADGSGDVIIATRRWKTKDGDEINKEIGFLGIRNPQEVEKILKQLAENTD